MLTQREAFKVGFVHRCIEEGLAGPQIEQLAKQALDKLALPIVAPILEHTLTALKGAGKWGIPLGLALPPLAGAGAGYAAGRYLDPSTRGAEEVKSEELSDEYRRQAKKLRLAQQLDTLQRNRESRRPVFG